MTNYFFSSDFGRLLCSGWPTSKDTQRSEIEQFKSQYNKWYQAHALGFSKSVLERSNFCSSVNLEQLVYVVLEEVLI